MRESTGSRRKTGDGGDEEGDSRDASDDTKQTEYRPQKGKPVMVVVTGGGIRRHFGCYRRIGGRQLQKRGCRPREFRKGEV